MPILLNGFRGSALQTLSLLRHSFYLCPKPLFVSYFCAALSPFNDVVPSTDSSSNSFEFDERFQNILKKLSVHNQPLPQVENLGSYERLSQLSQLLRGCASKECLNEGKTIHGLVIKNGVDPYWDFGNFLVGLYVKCGIFKDAVKMIDEMPKRNIMFWNELISELVNQGYYCDGIRLYCELRKDGVVPDGWSLMTALKACLGCLDLDFGTQLHAEVVKHGLDVVLGSSLVKLYAKCGQAKVADRIFFNMPKKNVVSWNVLLDGYAMMSEWEDVLRLFSRIEESEFKYRKFTLLTVLNGYSQLGNLAGGQLLHAVLIKIGCELDKFLSSCLVDMYSKCGLADDALKIFKAIKNPKVVAWSTMINCLDQHGRSQEAAKFFCLMRHIDVRPNQYTLAIMVTAATNLGDKHHSESIHACVFKFGFESDTYIGHALIMMYRKTGSSQDEWKVFNSVVTRDVGLWDSFLYGHVKTDLGVKALCYLNQMQQEGLKPKESTLSICLTGCSSFAMLESGQQFHSLALKSGISNHVYVACALVNMYAKSRCIKDAEAVFKGLASKNIVSWNAIICGYSHNGFGKKALEAFSSMLDEGFAPDEITFIGVLSACSHMGLVCEGKMHFNSLSKDYGFTPKIEHCASVVNILSRAGEFSEVETFLEEWNLTHNSLIWETILWGCKIHGNVEFGERAAEKLLELEPSTDYIYILLSNIYAANGRWADVAKIRELISKLEIKKQPACSWLELGSQVHAFLAQDTTHPNIKEIHLTLEGLASSMRTQEAKHSCFIDEKQ